MRWRIIAALAALLFPTLALAQPVPGSGLPQPIINGDCLVGQAGNVAHWAACGGGGLTNPFTDISPALWATDTTSGFGFAATTGLPQLVDGPDGFIVGFSSLYGQIIGPAPAINLLNTGVGNSYVVIAPGPATGGAAGLEIDSYGAGSSLTLYGAAGTQDATTAVTSGQTLGVFQYAGAVGAGAGNSNIGANIVATAGEAWSGTKFATALAVGTIDTVSETLHPRLVIDGSGNVTFPNGGVVAGASYPAGCTPATGLVCATQFQVPGGAYINELTTGGAVGLAIQGADNAAPALNTTTQIQLSGSNGTTGNNPGGTLAVTGGDAVGTGRAGDGIFVGGNSTSGTAGDAHMSGGNAVGGAPGTTFLGGNTNGASAVGSVVAGGALATNATTGFFYLDTAAGVPSGVPATQSGTVALVYDTTDSRLYAYNGGWANVAGGSYSAPTLGSTSIGSGATVTAITGMASFGITAPAANSTALTLSGASHTGSNATSDVSWAGTWNTTGSPTAFLMNWTNTASGATTKLIDLQIGSATKFNVDKTGAITLGAVGNSTIMTTTLSSPWRLYQSNNGNSYLDLTGSLEVQGSTIILGSTAVYRWATDNTADNLNTDTGLSRISAGLVGVGNGGAADFSGGMKMTALTMNGPIVRKGYTVATLPVSPGTGAMAYVTDAVACTFLATLTGGSSTYCPVGYNGSAWVGE